MQTQVGDRLIVKGHNLGDPDRDAETLEVRGPGDTPAYVVCWDEDGRIRLFFPGPDVIHHFEHARHKQ